MAEPTAVQKRSLAKLGYAMPDGSYYIRAGSVGASDLDNAIKAVGRGEPQSSHNAIRVHIIKRAKALGLSDKIPGDWQADGSLRHDALDELADGFLKHFGITGMRWGQHLPGTEAVGGKGNPDGANGPSAKYLPAGSGSIKKAAFIQRGDQSGNSPGSSNSSSSGQDDAKPPEQQANESVDFLKNLRDHVASQADAAQSEVDALHAPSSGQQSSTPAQSSSPASGKTKSGLTTQQAQAVHQATKKHLANVTQLHNKAKAAQAAHKKNKTTLAKSPHKGRARQAIHAASKQHAAHMNHLKNVAQAAHKAHLAHVAKLKSKHTPVVNGKAKTGHLSAADQAALRKLSPAQRSALKKVPANLRAHAGNLTLKQMNNLRLTPNERTALSHLSPAQKAALAKATAASAKARHEAALALAKKVGIAGNKSVAAAKKATAAAQAHRTTAQKAAFNKLRLNAQNGTGHAMDDPEGTFLEHFGVKGMKWGVRRNGGHPGRIRAKVPVDSSQDHQQVQLIKAKVKAHGGIHALSNDELETLARRLNLEANYNRLHPETGSVERARKFVKTVTGDAKTVLDAVETGRRVVKLANGDKKAA